MAKNPTEKRILKKRALIDRTARILGVTTAEAEAYLRIPRHQSVRLNPLKGDVHETQQMLATAGWRGTPVSWMPTGLASADPLETARDSVAVQEGRAFIQNAASWLPVIALGSKPGETVLDVCAAPGGKTSHIAAMANNQALITANDNSRVRLNKLIANLQRLGVKNVQTTLYDATYIAKKAGEQQFDKVLLDAPCSGEGMMHLDNDKDFDTWSVAHIKRLQQLQKRLVSQAWQLLKPGGTLVYSTCTMAPEENEAVVSYLLRNQPDARIMPVGIHLPNQTRPVLQWNDKAFDHRVKDCLRLKPSPEVEAFFVCKITKADG